MAAPHYEAAHAADVTPGPVPAYVPDTTISAGAYIVIAPTHVPVSVSIVNTGPADLIVAANAAAAAAGIGLKLLAGQTLELRTGMGEIAIGNPSATLSGSASAVLMLSRRPWSDDIPAVTEAESFPAYDGADPHAIAPGVE